MNIFDIIFLCIKKFDYYFKLTQNFIEDRENERFDLIEFSRLHYK